MSTFWKNRRVIVTGGGGFLGSAVVLHLQALGAQEIFVPRRVDYDLRDPSAVARAFNDSRPDIVFHLAAVVGGIKANIEHPGEFFLDNTLLNTLVIEAARKHGVQKLVTVGSICAYPARMDVPLREERMWDGYPEPTNGPYGISKRNSWVQLDAYRKQFGFNGIYLIPASMYGPRDSLDLDRSHVTSALIQRCMEAKRRGDQSVTVWGTGKPTREFYYVEDAARVIVNAAESYDDMAPLNIGSGVETSIRELASLIARLTDFKGEIVFDTIKPDGELRRLFDSSKARTVLGEISPTSLEDGLRRTIEWHESRI